MARWRAAVILHYHEISLKGGTRPMFLQGRALCVSVSGRLGLELRSVWLGGMRILDRIEQNEFDVFRRRPVITSADKLKILLGAARKMAFRRY